MKLRTALSFILLIVGQASISAAWASENSEATKSMRKHAINSGKIGKTITYGSKDKGEVWLFTDMGCPACIKLHTDVVRLTELGVQVHVMAFPRQGLGSPGYTKWVAVACSKDPATALTQAMRGEPIPVQTCSNSVQTQYFLGQNWGLAGTPTIIFADGTQWTGYFAPDRLAEEVISRAGN